MGIGIGFTIFWCIGFSQYIQPILLFSQYNTIQNNTKENDNDDDPGIWKKSVKNWIWCRGGGRGGVRAFKSLREERRGIQIKKK